MGPIRLTIGSTRPTTKKTSGDVVFKRVPTAKLPAGICAACHRGSLPIVLPAENYVAFEKLAAPELQSQWARIEPRRAPCRRCKGTGLYGKGKKQELCIGCSGDGIRALSIDEPVIVEAMFYRQTDIGDLSGYHQALGDTLQTSGVLANDRLIVGWPLPSDGRLSLRKDAASPRVELVITPLAIGQSELAL